VTNWLILGGFSGGAYPQFRAICPRLPQVKQQPAVFRALSSASDTAGARGRLSVVVRAPLFTLPLPVCVLFTVAVQSIGFGSCACVCACAGTSRFVVWRLPWSEYLKHHPFLRISSDCPAYVASEHTQEMITYLLR
jgi:hypothetical protein